MNAGFRWEQPEYLVLIFAVACALAAYRWGRRAALFGASVDAASANSSNRADQRVARRPMLAGVALLAGLLAGLLACLVGAALIGLRNSRAMLAAGVVGGLAAAWLAARLYRGRHDARGSGRLYWLLVILRSLAALTVLAIVARPVFEWEELTWRKPLLAVVLDQSQSMGICDDQTRQTASRAEMANAALQRSRAAIDHLQSVYEVQLCSANPAASDEQAWHMDPATPFSALAAAIHDAGQLRSPDGGRPAAVVLLSDGAENVETPQALRNAAETLAAQGTALLAVGVGPEPGVARTMELDPLFVPARLGSRDRVRVPITARIQNCRGASVQIEVLWNGQRAEVRNLPIQGDQQRLQVEFELLPPAAAGPQRLTARATLPAALGGQQVETHAVVDVRDERIRVLYLEDAPHTESAFVSRALQADPRFDLTSRFLFSGAPENGAALANARVPWADYDVVILGRLAPLGADAPMKELATAVTHRGVGLLLIGGRRLFNDGDGRHSPLAALAPSEFVRDQFGLPGPLEFIPTRAGLLHPVLRGTHQAKPAESLTSADALARWRALPRLGAGALLGEPKPLATVLAREAGGRPLLVSHEVGAGRCLAAAFESTWPWALGSDEGAALHRRFWSQTVLWLANRRPRAWVLTDHPSYALAALKSGQARVHIRAGLSQSDLSDSGANFRSATARLELVLGEQRVPVRLEQHGDEWQAELSGLEVAELPAGQHQLEFNVGDLSIQRSDSAPASAASQPDLLTARTEFALLQTQLEFEPPTANLALLRSAAEATAGVGGAYCAIENLPTLLDRLSRTDRRQEVRRPMRYAPVDEHAWTALCTAAALLGLEWLIRKRAGLP